MAEVGIVWVRGLGGHPGVEQHISCSPAACFACARGLESRAGGWLLWEGWVCRGGDAAREGWPYGQRSGKVVSLGLAPSSTLPAGSLSMAETLSHPEPEAWGWQAWFCLIFWGCSPVMLSVQLLGTGGGLTEQRGDSAFKHTNHSSFAV